jgi:hypothetical protein
MRDHLGGDSEAEDLLGIWAILARHRGDISLSVGCWASAFSRYEMIPAREIAARIGRWVPEGHNEGRPWK